jgi:hypothetical protein
MVEQVKLPHVDPVLILNARQRLGHCPLCRQAPKIVSERLGHSSIALTLHTYSHALPGMQDEAASKLEAMLFRGDGTSEARAFN